MPVHGPPPEALGLGPAVAEPPWPSSGPVTGSQVVRYQVAVGRAGRGALRLPLALWGVGAPLCVGVGRCLKLA